MAFEIVLFGRLTFETFGDVIQFLREQQQMEREELERYHAGILA